MTQPTIVWHPIVALNTAAIIGHEALARFPRGNPEQVFAEAAKHGSHVVRALDAQCRQIALEQCPERGWVFVNVHPASIRAESWPTIDNPAVASRVIWELPEAAGWGPHQVPPDQQVALDDVGSGYGELLRLARIPWRYLKLDKSLVSQVPQDLVVRALVHDLVHMAADRGGAVIGEGVEQQREADALAALGVTYGQGFLWGPPALLSD